jgi:hypothetical protein
VSFLGDVLILRLSILNSAYLARSKVLVGDSELVNANAFFWWCADRWSFSGYVDRSNHFRANLLMEFDMRSTVLSMNNRKSLIVSSLGLSILLSSFSMNFYSPAEAGGIPSAFQALFKSGRVTKVVKVVSAVGKAYTIYNTVQLISGETVRICQKVEANGRHGNPYYC